MFVYSAIEYFLWPEKFKLGDLREMDSIIRDILNKHDAKYKLQLNASLYLPRNKGGRGLRNFEMLYKKTKIKAAMNLLTGEDPRIKGVKEFDKSRMKKGKSSIISDAIRYATYDFNLTFDPLDSSFMVSVDGINRTCKINEVKCILKRRGIEKNVEEIKTSSWQGLILNSRYNDSELINKSFPWLTQWKDCPVSMINEIQSIHLQTIPTLTFKKYRTEKEIVSTVCRLCSCGIESVRHLLSSCNFILSGAYKRRHDKVLQLILFHFLHKHKVIPECPEWYSKICIKPKYEDDNFVLLWDIPEYSGYENEEEEHVLSPDGKLISKVQKQIWVLEMSVPWQ